jgi:3-oxoacyl-[acyl-carrier-protein] synthase-3
MGAIITGWGKCVPPAVLGNDVLATFMDTSDKWVTTRTGIRERRISHVGMVELSTVAAAHALAAAGVAEDEFDCLILATASADLHIPNAASRVQLALGNRGAAALDTNVGCCGFAYGLAMANGLIESGVHSRVVVIGAERLTTILDWTQRDSAILFGDGAGAVVVEAGQSGEGVLGAFLACDPVPGEALMVADLGNTPAQQRRRSPYELSFDGREVFRHAVPGMVKAAHQALARAGLSIDDIDLLVPHQANLRIVEAVGKKLPIDPAKVFTNLQRYGNTSAASIPLALTEALEAGRVAPGDHLLFTAFGAGLTSAALVVKWGERAEPRARSDRALPACEQSALELLTPALDFQRHWHQSH